MSNLKQCVRCKHTLDESLFYYRGKYHSQCGSCANSRTNIKNSCHICGIKASYNYEGEAIGIYCKKHAGPNMINIKSRKCVVCRQTHPTYNYEKEKRATHCKKCSLPNMVNIKSKKCVVCKKTLPSYNYEGKERATHCKGCSLPNMIDVKHPKCIVCKKTIPTYNYEGEGRATHCKGCSLPNMIDVKHPRCIVCKKTRPTYNYEGDERATHCKGCSLPNMIDIKNKKCVVCKKTRPSYSYEGEERATHCKKCSLPDMINVRDKNNKCMVCKKTRPTYNYEGQVKATHCKECSLPNMIDITHKKCIVCKKTRPSYSYEGEERATHCKKCSLPNMIDITHPKCAVCNKIASYGVPCNKPSCCSQHKISGMIIKPNSRCRKKECKEKAQYGIKLPIHCETHKTLNDINLVERECKKCKRIDVLNTEGICINFCSQEEKYEEHKKRQKIKEKRILKILTSELGEPSRYNTKITYDCGGKNSEQEEIVYDCKTHEIHIEVDERQHKSYCELGEINRMKNIFFANGIKTIFIRYNPDSFKINNKSQKLSPAKREEVLVKWIKYFQENEPMSQLSILYLFYNDYSETDKPFEIDPYDIKTYDCKECDKQFYHKLGFEKHMCVKN